MYKSTLSLQHSLARLKHAQELIEGKHYSGLGAFQTDILTVEGYYVDCHTFKQHQFELILDFSLIHSPPLPVMIAVKAHHKVYKQLRDLALCQLYEIHSLQIRPYRLRNESVVCILGTTKRTVGVR